jgi:localization factor PodJL
LGQVLRATKSLRKRRTFSVNTAVAVSMLALNLVLQRTTAPVSPPVEASVSPEAPAMSEPPAAIQPEAPASNPMMPAASENVSLVKPEPRVIDMVDSMATGSISPVSQGFSDNLDAAALSNTLKTAKPPSDIASTEAFELPPETLGPLALREAAAKGDARAQFEVAAIYAEGRAVPQDYAEAAKWYERAAAQAFVPAQYRLGNLYEAGQGVEQDYAVAKLWYQRAAEAGNRMGMHNLAALHAGGQLGDQQFEQAVEWFTRAAERGMTDSQFNLGMLYARGLGVAQDFEQSYLWFSLAARSGDADAAKARDDIAKSLTAESVTRLNGELSVWKAQPLEISANFAPLGTWSESFEVGETIVAKDVVSKVQSALMRIGYDVGTPDGVAGPRTAEAIKAFERSTGMSESGAINPRLLAVLGSQPV